MARWPATGDAAGEADEHAAASRKERGTRTETRRRIRPVWPRAALTSRAASGATKVARPRNCVSATVPVTIWSHPVCSGSPGRARSARPSLTRGLARCLPLPPDDPGPPATPPRRRQAQGQGQGPPHRRQGRRRDARRDRAGDRAERGLPLPPLQLQPRRRRRQQRDRQRRPTPPGAAGPVGSDQHPGDGLRQPRRPGRPHRQPHRHRQALRHHDPAPPLGRPAARVRREHPARLGRQPRRVPRQQRQADLPADHRRDVERRVQHRRPGLHDPPVRAAHPRPGRPLHRRRLRRLQVDGRRDRRRRRLPARTRSTTRSVTSRCPPAPTSSPAPRRSTTSASATTSATAPTSAG